MGMTRYRERRVKSFARAKSSGPPIRQPVNKLSIRISLENLSSLYQPQHNGNNCNNEQDMNNAAGPESDKANKPSYDKNDRDDVK